MIDLILRNALLEKHQQTVDLAINDGKILECGKALPHKSVQELDLNHRLVIPGFIDPHVHLDIALMNSREVPGRAKRFYDTREPNQEIERRRKAFTHESIKERARAALRLASRHGVTAVRAQCHIDTEVGLKHLKALLEVKEEFARRVTVQIVAFPQQGLMKNPGTLDLFREALKAGADVMGGASNHDPVMRDHIDAAFDLAIEFDVDLDIHADLGLADCAQLEDLEVVYIAKQAIARGYQGRVTVGHACKLGSAPPEVADQAIELLKEADISVISQPDLYRLGREDTYNVRRGLTRVKELLDAGVNVTYASNNIQDGYRPMGNFDPLEEALILSYGAHMDVVEDYSTLLKMATIHGARAIGLDNHGLEPGCVADLVVLDAGCPSAAVIYQVEKRYVFKAGKLMAENQLISTLYNGA